MRSQELKVSPKSDYYIYTPTALAEKLYLFPLITGYFYYEPGYFIQRQQFDNFLLMYIAKGSCQVTLEDGEFRAQAGQFVLLDCYAPHRYGSRHAWEASWIHFDGPMARAYFQEITASYGQVLSPANTSAVSQNLYRIYEYFRNSRPISEASISRSLTDILNSFLFPASSKENPAVCIKPVSDSLSYINEHFHEPLSLEQLAAKAGLSLYHFTRIFAKETGFTPHQYLINTRLSAAKFLLKSSEASVKDIGFSTGFHSESSFCSTFKKHTGITPSQYRDAE